MAWNANAASRDLRPLQETGATPDPMRGMGLQALWKMHMGMPTAAVSEPTPYACARGPPMMSRVPRYRAAMRSQASRQGQDVDVPRQLLQALHGLYERGRPRQPARRSAMPQVRALLGEDRPPRPPRSRR